VHIIKIINLQIGLKDLFTGSADFSGITAKGGEPLFISKVIQKAFIEVNEKGSSEEYGTYYQLSFF
jgi:serine protease inhibitor